MKRPNTAFNKRKIRPKTAINNSMNYKKLENNNSIFADNSNMNIPPKIKNKFEEEIKQDYNYKDDFFDKNSDDSDDNENENVKEINNIEKLKIINDNNKLRKFKYYDSLMRGFQENQLQNYSIKIDQADTDLLDLFDRAQKTNAATKAKDINFDYYSQIKE